MSVEYDSMTRDAVAPPAAMISCTKLGKTFRTGNGTFVALDGVDLDVATDEFVTVLGPSGCGKSTLMNMMAGFESPTAGSLFVDGSPVGGPSPDKGVVFQDFALFPWLSVRRNVGYGLREKGIRKSEAARLVTEMLELVGLEQVADHYPHQLSGGMKQRVSLARVLAIDPKILLMDEPFGALDEQRRVQLQDELLRIWEQRRKTAVFITHSIEEAIALGDRVVVMAANPGRIKTIVPIPLDRPRDRTSSEFNELRKHVTAELWS
ncbi:ABC transporter ATP-binding protein [Nocardia sp. BMG51109]|uniref:ABC transporter ATP-binding protein n=1 Tax=Nocardia sp. BMG51109 TaxID=1056816 RepID=UPI0004663403|nr:ABC transporter ATP-binding protein [Nocardia sp. BMG51109]